MLCFLLQPKFTLDGTLAINFLVQAQWCWFLISSRSTMSIYYCTYHGSRQELSHCCIYAMYVVEWCEGCTYWLACKNFRPILQLNFFIQICFAWECRIVINEQISTHDGTFDKRCTRWNFESLVWFQEKIFCPTNQKCNLLCSNLLSMHLTLLNPLQTQ